MTPSVLSPSNQVYDVVNVWLRVCSQVADECLAPDVLSTVKEMKAVNFRRVPKMPVYGMAQPTSEVRPDFNNLIII